MKASRRSLVAVHRFCCPALVPVETAPQGSEETAPVIIMLNGSFGVGKSTIAKALCQALPNTTLYNPEIVGIALRQLTEAVRMPEEATGDFQDLALWPTAVVTTADQLFHHYQRSLIVPMMLVRPGHLDQIKAGLAKVDPPLYHFCLTASLATIYHRLHSRDDANPADLWRHAQQAVPLFSDLRYATHVDTEGVTPTAIVQRIASYITSDPGASTGTQGPTAQIHTPSAD